VNAQHFVVRVCEQPGVDRDEILRAGLRSAILGSSFLFRVEDIRRYLHKLAEEYFVDRDLDRHDGKLVLFGKTDGKIACGIRYNMGAHAWSLRRPMLSVFTPAPRLAFLFKLLCRR